MTERTDRTADCVRLIFEDWWASDPGYIQPLMHRILDEARDVILAANSQVLKGRSDKPLDQNMISARLTRDNPRLHIGPAIGALL